MAAQFIMCDTDVLIDYWDTSSKRYLPTKEIIDNKIGIDNVVISAITKMELLMGSGNKVEEEKIKKKLFRLNMALINNEITEEAITLFEAYRLSHGLAIPDCLIAATAKITGLKLFTYNLRDYKFIEGIKLYRF